VAGYFLQKGYNKVFVLQGGWKAWLGEGYPIENQ
jgi:rhodanese-related sulfurtransferase